MQTPAARAAPTVSESSLPRHRVMKRTDGVSPGATAATMMTTAAVAITEWAAGTITTIMTAMVPATVTDASRAITTAAPPAPDVTAIGLF